MQLLLEVDDTLVPALNQYLAHQRTIVNGIAVPVYNDVEEFIIKQVGLLLKQIVQQFPSGPVLSKIQEINQKQAELDALVTPRKVSAVVKPV